jgi:hypothetical protein
VFWHLLIGPVLTKNDLPLVGAIWSPLAEVVLETLSVVILLLGRGLFAPKMVPSEDGRYSLRPPSLPMLDEEAWATCDLLLVTSPAIVLSANMNKR